MSLILVNGAQESIRLNNDALYNPQLPVFMQAPLNGGNTTQGGVIDPLRSSGFAFGQFVRIPDGRVLKKRTSQVPFVGLFYHDFYYVSNTGIETLIPASLLRYGDSSIFTTESLYNISVNITTETAWRLWQDGFLTEDNVNDNLGAWLSNQNVQPIPVPRGMDGATLPLNPDRANVFDAVTGGSKALIVLAIVGAAIWFIPKNIVRG